MNDKTRKEVINILASIKGGIPDTGGIIPARNSDELSDELLNELIVEDISKYEQPMKMKKPMDGKDLGEVSFFVIAYGFDRICGSDYSDDLWDKFCQFQRLLRALRQARSEGRSVPGFNIFDMKNYDEILKSLGESSRPGQAGPVVP